MRFLTISNLLSLLRAPLAILFLFPNRGLRVLILALAALSDYFDGFIARRWGKATQFGAVLDPVMDKFFMIFVFSVLVSEGSLAGWEMVAMLFRDLCLAGFVLFLLATKGWKVFKARAVWWGKVTTVAQYAVLFLISFGVIIPPTLYLVFFLLGLLYFGELLVHYRRKDQA